MFFFLIFILNESFGQEITGFYIQKQTTSFQKDKVPLSEKLSTSFLRALVINRDNSFRYIVPPSVDIIGNWFQKDSCIYFFQENTKSKNRACNGLNLIKVEKHYNKTLKIGRAISIVDVSNDSTQFAGISILSAGKTYIMGIDKPILLLDDDAEIELEFLSYKLRYLLNSSNANTYKLFVCWGPKEGYLEAGKLPFNQLFFKEDSLVNLLRSILFVKQ
jgi:hypothetical protein